MPVVDAQTLGAPGGALSQSTTLVAANLPPITSTNAAQAISVTSTISDVVFASGGLQSATAGGRGGAAIFNNIGGTRISAITSTDKNSISVTSTGTTSTPIIKETAQPTIVMNYIFKR